MKRPIEWHEKLLANRISYAEERQADAVREQERINLSVKYNIFLAHQIEQAKKQRKDGFDNERFLAKQRPEEI